MARVEIVSEVTGNVWKVEAGVGDQLENEAVIVILESMKMEIPVEATCAGTLVELLVSEGDSVEEDQVVAILESDQQAAGHS
jgi:acetyl-CoA carboxylase biotin carboxyl carrier protein